MSSDYIPQFLGEFTGTRATKLVSWHLKILELFRSLLENVEKTDFQSIWTPEDEYNHVTPQDLSQNSLRVFLAFAETRYHRYLDLISQDGIYRKFPIVPPWDVAIILHSHMLAPLSFKADTSRERWKLNLDNFSFPFDKFAALILSDTWSDPEAEIAWTTAYPSVPYQLWTGPPKLGGKLIAYPAMKGSCVCPYCYKTHDLEFSEWILLRLNIGDSFPGPIFNCRSRGKGSKAKPSKPIGSKANSALISNLRTDISVLNFKYDLQKFKETKSMSAFKGSTSPDSYDKYTRAFIKVMDACFAYGNPNLWGDTTRYEPQQSSLFHFGSNIAPKLVASYLHTLWPDFSIDLVEAVLRQRKFIDNISHNRAAAMDETLDTYLKFMHLMKDTKTTLVPSLGIDLFWHTHQLLGGWYYKFCVENIGRVINHDDKSGEAELEYGRATTLKAWKEAFPEEGSQENPYLSLAKLSDGPDQKLDEILSGINRERDSARQTILDNFRKDAKQSLRDIDRAANPPRRTKSHEQATKESVVSSKNTSTGAGNLVTQVDAFQQPTMRGGVLSFWKNFLLKETPTRDMKAPQSNLPTPRASLPRDTYKPSPSERIRHSINGLQCLLERTNKSINKNEEDRIKQLLEAKVRSDYSNQNFSSSRPVMVRAGWASVWLLGHPRSRTARPQVTAEKEETRRSMMKMVAKSQYSTVYPLIDLSSDDGPLDAGGIDFDRIVTQAEVYENQTFNPPSTNYSSGYHSTYATRTSYSSNYSYGDYGTSSGYSGGTSSGGGYSGGDSGGGYSGGDSGGGCGGG